MSATTEDTITAPAKTTGLERGIDWTGAIWVASGVPPLVLFSIGAVAATVGKLSWVIWAAAIGFWVGYAIWQRRTRATGL